MESLCPSRTAGGVRVQSVAQIDDADRYPDGVEPRAVVIGQSPYPAVFHSGFMPIPDLPPPSPIVKRPTEKMPDFLPWDF